ncbi:MAG: polysaccharide deacetylase family protein [Syntrophales bacterium]|nr:polysaccharide deacetylase family protein [Syntrophales bacterium]MDD5643564.1 polysaccharide deacetylase family protein [Syntrophales bacterium]
MPPKLGLKVDVDTLQGFREGVPALLEILAARGIKASFFVALGPDNSGKAIFRVFRQQGFLEKMWRTRAPALYGLRTMFYGTLLPAPLIGESAGEILPIIAGAGHEVGLHGYDHVRWHDHLLTMSREEVSRELARAQELFASLLGHPARSFAAPGWQCSAAHRAVLAASGFLYSSDTRGSVPYFPRFGEEINPLLEIPTTLPTLDELLGFNGCSSEDFTELVLSRVQKEKVPQVLTVHAEVEGGPLRGDFAGLLDRCREQGVEFLRLEDWARELLAAREKIPVAGVRQGRLPGRAGTVSCQGNLETKS